MQLTIFLTFTKWYTPMVFPLQTKCITFLSIQNLSFLDRQPMILFWSRSESRSEVGLQTHRSSLPLPLLSKE